MNKIDNLVQTYKWLRQFGLNDSHSGNGSTRDGDNFLITSTGACADTLTTADLICCSIQKPPPENASLDCALHQAVYKANPEAQAVLHSHNPYTVALTLNGKNFIPVDFEGFYYFGSVPIVDIDFEHYVEEAPEKIASLLTNHRIAVVRGHGVYSCAETLNLAYKWICSLEQSAKTAYLAHTAGTL